MRLSILVLGLALAWLGGCAELPSRPVVSHLQGVATPRSIVLDQPLSWRLDYRPSDLGVVPGVYHAYQENALGTFFRGPPAAYFLLTDEDNGASSIERTDGGLWIPKDGGPAKVWGWFDHNHPKVKQVLDRRATLQDIVPLLAAAPTGVTGTQPATRMETASRDIVVQQVALGQVPGGIGGAAAAGVGGAIGGALAGAAWSYYIGMRDVILFDPPMSDARALEQLKALTQSATSGR